MAIRSTDLAPDIAKALGEKESKLLDESSSTPPATDGEGKPKDDTLDAPPPLTPQEKRAEEVLVKHGAKKGTTVADKIGATAIGAAACAGGYFLTKPAIILAIILYLFGALMLCY